MFRFFKQPQLNTFNRALISTELLVYKHRDDDWCLSRTVNQLTLLNLLRSLSPDFQTKLPSVAINCTQSQFTNAVISDALINLQHQLYPKNLRIELTLGKSVRQMTLLIAQSENYRQHGIQICLDATEHIEDPESLLPLLTQTREIKYGMNGVLTEPQQLKHWQALAKQYHQRFVVYNVTSKADHLLLDHLDVALRQGDYYGIAEELILNQPADIA